MSVGVYDIPNYYFYNTGSHFFGAVSVVWKNQKVYPVWLYFRINQQRKIEKKSPAYLSITLIPLWSKTHPWNKLKLNKL